MSVCQRQLFSAPSRSTLVSEVPNENSQPTLCRDSIPKAILLSYASLDTKINNFKN